MTPFDASPARPRPVVRARRQLIAHRLPLFAVAWLGTTLVWSAVLVVEGLVATPLALVLPAAHAVILAAALARVRADPGGPGVRRTIAAACVLLGVSTTVWFAVLGGDGDLLAFVLMTLYLAAALFFAWGWATALAVLVGTVVPWLCALPHLRFHMPTVELVAAIGVGSTVCLAIAEVAARTFGVAFERGERERQASDALARSRDAYRDLAENASDLIYTHDLEGRLTYVNRAFARFAGAPTDALVGRSCAKLMASHPAAPDVGSLIARIVAGEPVAPVEIPVAGPDGLRWLECAISDIRGVSGAVIGVRGIARDVTDRRRAEEQLHASLAELRHNEEMLRLLARRQATIREEERKRLGFDLHDDVCQELLGLGIMLAGVRRRLDGVAPAEDERLAIVVRHLHAVVEHLRNLAHDLRPLLLRDLGLEDSLRSLAEAMSEPTTLVSLTVTGSVPRLDEAIEIGVYRIAQEALANAARHAGARTIVVTLAVVGSMLELEVRDDGCGFVAGEGRKPQLGLVAMQEHALALGGRVALTSEPGRGTTVRLECPIAEPARATAI
jgi:two-component system sensor histidine kinase UhpB